MEKHAMPDSGTKRHPTAMDSAIRALKKGQSNKRRAELEKNLVEEWGDEALWSLRQGGGWIALPKHIPALMSLIDELAQADPAGKAAAGGRRVAGRVYLALLAGTWEGVPLVTVKDEDELAMWAGLGGKQRRYALRAGLLTLEALGFISIVGDPGEWRLVLLRNPPKVLEELQKQGRLVPDLPWYRFWTHMRAHRPM
jgi:hypothetical protein